MTNVTTRRRQFESSSFETDYNYEIEITKCTGVSCKKLEDDIIKQHAPQHSQINARQDCEEDKLEIIIGPDGYVTFPTTDKQCESGRKVGTDVNQKCFI